MAFAAETFDSEAAARRLLTSLDAGKPDAVLPLPGGRNNLVWKVISGSSLYLLKHYFWSKNDPRDRLGQEWAFLTFLRRAGIHSAPEPLARDTHHRCTLLEFISGKSVAPEEVRSADVLSAADFFRAMNAAREHAHDLPGVSEACFSIAAHLQVTRERILRLNQIRDAEAIALVRTELHPLWQKISARIETLPRLEIECELPPAERCLSPSDFGFHNTLRQPDGSLRFVDFEYAGWDDPAKTIADFCNQPDGLLQPEFAEIFCRAAINAFPNPESLRQRLTLLEPLYQLKWACICLNGFLPGGRFDPARPDRSPAAQLLRARIMLARAAEKLDLRPHHS
jgi:hypothetical protein